jgi:hypothetical protein
MIILLSMPFDVRESQEAENGLWIHHPRVLIDPYSNQQRRSKSEPDLQELPIKRQRGLLSDENLCTLYDLPFLNCV